MAKLACSKVKRVCTVELQTSASQTHPGSPPGHRARGRGGQIPRLLAGKKTGRAFSSGNAHRWYAVDRRRWGDALVMKRVHDFICCRPLGIRARRRLRNSRFNEIFLASSSSNQDSDAFPSCTVVIRAISTGSSATMSKGPGRKPRKPCRELGLLLIAMFDGFYSGFESWFVSGLSSGSVYRQLERTKGATLPHRQNRIAQTPPLSHSRAILLYHGYSALGLAEGERRTFVVVAMRGKPIHSTQVRWMRDFAVFFGPGSPACEPKGGGRRSKTTPLSPWAGR